MKRSGDELNLSEGERGSKRRKTINFALADRDGIEGNAPTRLDYRIPVHLHRTLKCCYRGPTVSL